MKKIQSLPFGEEVLSVASYREPFRRKIKLCLIQVLIASGCSGNVGHRLSFPFTVFTLILNFEDTGWEIWNFALFALSPNLPLVSLFFFLLEIKTTNIN